MTGEQRILDYMRSAGRPVTVMDIQQHCATFDGRKYISMLRQAGHKIIGSWAEGQNRFGDRTRFKEYWLDEQQA